MMKRIAACLTALLLLAGGLAAAEEPDGDSRLTVGSTTQMRGEFFTEAWGNATSDYDARDLLHGYNLILWDGDLGRFEIDHSAVSAIAVTENDRQDRSYMLVLQSGLTYSDGTPITAWDYAFSFLIRLSPLLKELGGQPEQLGYLLGYDAYVSGQTNRLAGVRVSAENTLVITVRHEYLPFFYELGLLRCNPYPISVIAPGVAVRDDGDGVYLANADGTEPTLFTAELLRKTLCDPETGYRSHPSVVSGPYTLVSWDGVTAEFEINPYFRGDHAGNRPTIRHLTYTLAENETMIQNLQDGTFGLLNKVMNAETILAGMGGIANGDFQMSSYPRIGVSYLSFCCEKQTVASQAVRQAIAWCLDRDQVVSAYTGNFGIRSDGYYGIGQWMYGILQGTVAVPLEEPDPADKAATAAYEEQLAAWDELSLDSLTAYTVDPEKALKLLEEDGWKMNARGIREKEIDGETVALDLTLVYPEGSSIADAFSTAFLPNLELAGIRLTMKAVPMPELLSMYYRQAERDADLICLASNFDLVFDPSVCFREEEGGYTWYNAACADEELYTLAEDLRRTEPGDVLGYCRKWLAFQQRFNETLPMLPMYTNVYFDFYTNALQDYPISASVTWSQAILSATLGEAPEEE